jgi:hypothetical protein
MAVELEDGRTALIDTGALGASVIGREAGSAAGWPVLPVPLDWDRLAGETGCDRLDLIIGQAAVCERGFTAWPGAGRFRFGADPSGLPDPIAVAAYTVGPSSAALPLPSVRVALRVDGEPLTALFDTGAVFTILGDTAGEAADAVACIDHWHLDLAGGIVPFRTPLRRSVVEWPGGLAVAVQAGYRPETGRHLPPEIIGMDAVWGVSGIEAFSLDAQRREIRFHGSAS